MSIAVRGLTPAQFGRRPARPSAFEALNFVAPLTVSAVLVVRFQPFYNAVKFPGFVSSALVPALCVAVLATTPSQRLRSIPIVWSTMALALWFVMSRGWTLSAGATDFAIRSEVPALVLTALVAGTIEPRVLVRTLTITFVGIVVWSLGVSLLSVDAREVELAGGDEKQVGFLGLFDHKNLLGVFSVYTLGLVLAFVRGSWRWPLIAVTVGTIVGTRSATAAGGLLVAIFLWSWILAIGSRRTPRERALLRIASLVSAVSAVLVTVQALPALLDIYQKDLTFSGRTVIWAETWRFVTERPLLGYGFGGVWTESPPTAVLDLRRRVGFAASHAHSGPLGLWLEVGVIGLVLFASLAGAVASASMWCLRKAALHSYGVWGVITLASMLLMSASEPLYDGPDLCLLAVVVVVLLRTRNDARGADGLDG